MRYHPLLFAGAVLAGLTLFPKPVVAQPGAPVAMADTARQTAELREELATAQQEIVRLRAQLANQQDLDAAFKVARDRNDRLVAISKELIAAYERRYRHGQYLPFDVGRRKFEVELQDMSDRVHDNRWNAGPRRASSPPSGDASPAPTSAGAGQSDR